MHSIPTGSAFVAELWNSPKTSIYGKRVLGESTDMETDIAYSMYLVSNEEEF